MRTWVGFPAALMWSRLWARLHQATLQRLNPTSDLQPLLQYCDILNSLSPDWTISRTFSRIHTALTAKMLCSDEARMKRWGKHGESSGWFQTDHFIVSVQTRTSTAADGSSHSWGVQHLWTDRKWRCQGQPGSYKQGIYFNIDIYIEIIFLQVERWNFSKKQMLLQHEYGTSKS